MDYGIIFLLPLHVNRIIIYPDGVLGSVIVMNNFNSMGKQLFVVNTTTTTTHKELEQNNNEIVEYEYFSSNIE